MNAQDPAFKFVKDTVNPPPEADDKQLMTIRQADEESDRRRKLIGKPKAKAKAKSEKKKKKKILELCLGCDCYSYRLDSLLTWVMITYCRQIDRLIDTIKK